MKLILSNRGIIRDENFADFESGSVKVVYEVIRMIDGVALFLEDHFARLTNSVKMTGFELPFGLNEFRNLASELVQINQQKIGNVKFSCWQSPTGIEWTIQFIPHSYPEADVYLHGVDTDLLFAERENPNAKVVQSKIRETANRMLSELKLYEVLLVDQRGKITEGSRSNVFFVKQGVFYTAPVSDVLVGITRQKVIGCLKKLEFQLIEKAVLADEISQFDAAFLTGTSPKVLPVRSIGKTQFKSNDWRLQKLMEKYDQEILEYIELNRSF